MLKNSWLVIIGLVSGPLLGFEVVRTDGSKSPTVGETVRALNCKSSSPELLPVLKAIDGNLFKLDTPFLANFKARQKSKIEIAWVTNARRKDAARKLVLQQTQITTEKQAKTRFEKAWLALPEFPNPAPEVVYEKIQEVKPTKPALVGGISDKALASLMQAHYDAYYAD